MQGKTNLQQELGEAGQKSTRVKPDDADGKRTGPPVTTQHRDRQRHQLREIGLPEAGRKH